MKLNMRQTIAESCELNKEGYMHRRGGAKHGRAKVGVTNETWSIKDGEKERK